MQSDKFDDEGELADEEDEMMMDEEEEGEEEAVQPVPDLDDEWVEDKTGLWERIQAEGNQVRPPSSTPEAEIAKPQDAKEKAAPKPRSYETWDFKFRK